MTQNKVKRTEPTQWFPAERLGQLDVAPALRPWLIGKGITTVRMREACGEKFSLRLSELWPGPLSSAHQAILKVSDPAGLYREVELCSDEQVWVFVQSVIPDSTLSMHPWIAELGDTSLNETLAELSGVERSAYEYARLPAADALTARALRESDIKPDGLWARRSRVSLRAAPLLLQEVFLPAMGRT